jgi:membrane-associated protein
VTVLTALHGTTAVLLICALLYVEESGVPLPFLPGDALLIVAGVLIANGSISPWVFFPLAFAAILGGALTAYTWSRAVGTAVLETLAERFRATRHLQRVSDWLRAAGPPRIMTARLVPGMRPYTAMVAGAARVDVRVFLAGAIPAVGIWLLAFTVFGIVAGVPALASLSRVQHLAVTGAALVAIGLGTFLAVRRLPAGIDMSSPLIRAPRSLLLSLSVLIDLTVTVSVVSGVTELLHDGLGFQDPDGVIDLALISAVILFAYLAATRHLIGATAGERLLGVRYAATGEA